ncbi:MAG TPA: Hpt domain-containing protein [Planctomycetaceae bacterium]|jgi:HPt (histidine-containing phosphotransfer) domain-containing protein
MSSNSSASAAAVRSEYADDPDFRELLEEFTAAVPERRQGLIDAHRANDQKGLRTRAHQLKGAGGGFGFPQLSELAAELERACEIHDPVGTLSALEAVVDYLNRVTV